jgi:hypothetical protein
MRRAAPYGITPLVLVVCAVELVVALGRRPSNYQTVQEFQDTNETERLLKKAQQQPQAIR